MAQRQTSINGSCLRMFSQSVELRTVPADFAPPNLGSAFIMASLGNYTKSHLKESNAKGRKLHRDIRHCKRTLRAALSPSARSKKNSWRNKTDEEILELMQKRKISRYALEKNVGDLTRATYLYKMITLPTDKIPRTRPRYKIVLDRPVSAFEDVFEDPYKEFETAQKSKRNSFHQSKFDLHYTNPSLLGFSPRKPGRTIVVDEVPNSDEYIVGGKNDEDEVSPKHLLPHLASISNQSRDHAWSSISLGLSPPNQRAQGPVATPLRIPSPVRYRGFSGARVIPSAAHEPWKDRDTPSQLLASWTFPHRQSAKQRRPKTSSSRDASTEGLVNFPSN